MGNETWLAGKCPMPMGIQIEKSLNYTGFFQLAMFDDQRANGGGISFFSCQGMFDDFCHGINDLFSPSLLVIFPMFPNE